MDGSIFVEDGSKNILISSRDGSFHLFFTFGHSEERNKLTPDRVLNSRPELKYQKLTYIE